MAQHQLDGAGAIVVTKLDLVAPERRIRFSSMADEELAVQERDGMMVFIGFIDAAVEAALRDGIVQCSAVASMVAPTSTVD
ncbi:hypothetical protein [Burkholderia metallica]|uniref:hypothetical protein n=1 Tax=Burkholderia metallica TaxID=488729 RepID=UPI001F5B2C03|nr:hypothetical protein [Burkholderia metallica]